MDFARSVATKQSPKNNPNVFYFPIQKKLKVLRQKAEHQHEVKCQKSNVKIIKGDFDLKLFERY